MNRRDDDDRSAEAGFGGLHGLLLLRGGGTRVVAPAALILRVCHDTDLGDACLVKQIHDADEVLNWKVAVGAHDDG